MAEKPSMDVYYNEGPSKYGFLMAKYNYDTGIRDPNQLTWNDQKLGHVSYLDYLNDANSTARQAGTTPFFNNNASEGGPAGAAGTDHSNDPAFWAASAGVTTPQQAAVVTPEQRTAMTNKALYEQGAIQAPAPTAPKLSTYAGGNPTTPSIVEYLKSIGQNTDYASRSKLAADMGIGGYSGTASQNTQLLGMLRGSTPPTNGLAAKLNVGNGGNTVSADSISKGVTSTYGAGVGASTGNDNLNTIISTTLGGIDSALLKFFTGQEKKASDALATAEKSKTDLTKSFTDLSNVSSADELAKTMDDYKIKEKMDALNSVKEQMLIKQQALNLGVQQEADRIAPLEVLGRRQQKLKDQVAGELSALAVTAQVLQNDLTTAQYFAQMSFDALQADNTKKLSAYEFLLKANESDIVSLKADQKDAINGEIETIKSAMKTAQDNKDKVYDLIAKNPIAASKAGVSLTDDVDTAYTKMLPEMKKIAEQDRALELMKVQQDMLPSVVQEYEYAKNNYGFKGTLFDYLAQKEDSTNPSGPAAPKQYQFTAGNFATRMDQSGDIISGLESKFTGNASYIGQLLPNNLKTADRQQLEQAEKNFLNAVLRRESGAVISPTEFQNGAEQYFPQPGDSAEVLANKKANRELVTKNLITEAGSAIDELAPELKAKYGIASTNSTPQTFKSVADFQFNATSDQMVQFNAIRNVFPDKTPQEVFEYWQEDYGGGTGEKGGQISQNITSSFQPGQYGGQCGEFTHKIVDIPPMGDMYTEKCASVDKFGFRKAEWTPRVGDVVISDASDVSRTRSALPYGHAAVVASIKPNGDLVLIESNVTGKEKVSIGRTISPNDPAIYGALRGTIKQKFLT